MHRRNASRPGPADLLTWRAEPRPPWREFSLLTWNVLADCQVRPDWYPHVAPRDLAPARRRSRVLARLRELESDVMALQEVEPALLPVLARAFPTHHLTHAPHHGDGLAVLVRGGAERVEATPLPGGSKQALRVELPGGWLLAVVHLTWTGDPGPTARRGLAQLEAVLDWRPDLLVGDLNSFPTWPERRLAVRAGLIDGTPPGPTCNVKARLQPLDAVLHRPGWSCRAAPLPVIRADTPMPSVRHPSDHLPVRVQLRAPAAGLQR